MNSAVGPIFNEKVAENPCTEDPLHEYGMHDRRDINEIIYEGKPSISKILNFFS